MSVTLQIQKQLDNIAAYREALTQATASRTLLWLMAYDAADESYVNTVVNQTLTNLDNTMNAVTIGSMFGPWVALHNTYFKDVLGVTISTGQAGYLDAWLAGIGWRVSQYFNRSFFDQNGSYLTATNVFPRDDLILGTHAKTGNVFTPGTAVDLTQSGLGRVQAVVPTGTTIGGSTYTVTATLTKLAGTSLPLAAAFPSSSVAGTAIVFGEQALSGDAAASQKVASVAATAQFAVGEPVLFTDNQGTSEWGIVATVTTNTSLTMTNNLLNAYTTGHSSKVTPLFSAVTAATTANGTNGDNVSFRIAPDRAISLTGSA